MTMTEPHRVPLRSTDHFFIGGEWTEPSTSAVFDVVQPATEDVYFQVAEARSDDMARAVGAARTAFDDGPWPRMTHLDRAEYLRAIAVALRARSADIGQIWASQVGVLHSVAVASAPQMGGVFNYYAALASEYPFFERLKPRGGGAVGVLAHEPVGVVGAIVPWNGPLWTIAYKTAPALLAGCTVVLKASPEAPGEAYLLAEVAESVGLPPGVLNVVTADREVSELLVRDPRVDKITFTGSTAAGRRIGAICADRVARVTLELGGKSAAVILDDYDIGAAATALASAECFLSGQVCASLTRIIVTRARHDEFVEVLSAAFSKVRVGDHFDAQTEMGPLAMRRQRDRVEHYIAAGAAEGATLATGGGRPAHLERGFFIEPTVFANVDNDSTIAREEIFGPVLSVIPADDEAHAVRIANDTIYGLNASVFTNDGDRAFEVARQLRSGTVGHNAMRTDFSMGFGGYKQSGIGREGGREGLLPFLESKAIVLDAEPTSLGVLMGEAAAHG
ncbi:MAG: hypothetical protein JWN62_4628 [Acidimicrobiales bacterium]|nr:hypothetical protein [Acidimicrobiales bacterium]